MTQSLQLLKQRYLTNIKEQPTLFIGIELEFPIVNRSGQATDIKVAKCLLEKLLSLLGMKAVKWDRDGNIIQIKSEENQDNILFEVSYNTLEIAFGRVKTIQEAEARFEIYLQSIQDILRQDNHELQGYGVNPAWNKNDNRPVNAPRYQMLMQYLAMSQRIPDNSLHAYPEYGAFICGSQVQLDVSTDNYLRVINAFNAIEAAKAYLFANSELWGESWTTNISRDIFWEHSMHGIYPENVGVNPYDFAKADDFFSYLNHSAIFTAVREGETYFFYPVQVKDYLTAKEILAYSINGEKKFIIPDKKDFETHRSYQYQDLTTRGTVEFRSVCTQPFDRTFSVAAFHLGLLFHLEKLEDYLDKAAFFEENGRDYKFLRRQFSQKELTETEEASIRRFSLDLLQLAQEGLRKRNKNEESYLQILFEQF